MVGGIGLESYLDGTYELLKQKHPFGCFVVGGIGLEPTTFAMSTQRSNQLS